MAVSLTITYQLWLGMRKAQLHELQAEFDFSVERACALIEQRMVAYEHILIGARGLFYGSTSVGRDEFSAYVTSLHLEQHYPGIQGVGYAQIVPLWQKNAHIAGIRKQGFPEYAIKPEGKRELYVPIINMEPFSGSNLRAFGYDPYTVPQARSAMDQARDSDTAAISKKFTLVQETGNIKSAGFVMYLAVYKRDLPHGTTAERRANIIGWVDAPFRMNDLMSGLFLNARAGLDIRIYDGDEISDQAKLYDNHRLAPGGAATPLIRAARQIRITNHPWTMVFQSTPAFEARLTSRGPDFIAAAGIAISLLLAFSTWLLATGRERALALAQNMTAELRASEERWKFALEGAGDGVWDWDIKTSKVLFSKRWKEMLGFAEEEIGHSLDEWKTRLHPEDMPRTQAILQAHFEGRTAAYADEYRILGKNGSWVWILSRGMVVSRDNNGAPLRMIGTHSDITGRKLTEESMSLAALVYQASSEAMMVSDAEGNIITINPAFTRITGYTLEEIVGKNAKTLSSGRHDRMFFESMWHALNSTGKWQGEIWDRRKNGEVFPGWLTINTTFNADGSPHRRVTLFSDITDKKKSEKLIWQQANFDSLTGLPNRRMFHDRLEQEIKKSHRTGLPLALMFIDLDRFKEINDTLGHDTGDTLLKEAAQRLSACVRETDTVARLGGDEFTIIAGELDDLRNVQRVAQKILLALSEPFQLRDEWIYASASIGITLYPEDATGIEELLKNADQAMYLAKNTGRNRFSYFTKSMQEAAQNRMRLVSDMRSALAVGQFWLAYQPIVELTTGDIHKAEALIRWQHPERGPISPAEFIPLAEDTGLIIDIGDWVFHTAAQQVQHWRAAFHAEFQISVNKSPMQLYDENATGAAWSDHLRQLGLPGQSIVVEITEGLLMEAGPAVIDKLLAFRDAGVQVALDDFGTGYSSLSYLKKFDIDYLKIDQSFVRNLTPDSSDLALCEAIIVMAHKLGIKVIAEGIETPQQRGLLAAAGCDYGQGYLFSRPLPAAEFESLFGG
ncbi:MAG TPA: EAL domain-containing protein [Novimethylophilus sp.]|uniref:bifunctional diguanylate cyclase/phosphodiesterase n=1 Tax=Novimethylophilus sp. TaxID=2137426 RepID=UPI002F4300D6